MSVQKPIVSDKFADAFSALRGDFTPYAAPFQASTEGRGYTDRVFTGHYDVITRVLPFNEAWASKTGYFGPAVHEHNDHSIKVTFTADQQTDTRVCMYPGEMARSIDPEGRRLIFVATRLGCLVVFERYKTSDAHPVFVHNNSNRLDLTHRMPTGTLTTDNLYDLLGGGGVTNIGVQLEDLFEALVAVSSYN